MAEKWIKLLLQLAIGLAMLLCGIDSWKEAFNWFAWWSVLLGGSAIFFALDSAICLMDKYARWKI